MQARFQSNKSIPQRLIHPHFKYTVFFLPNSKVNFVEILLPKLYSLHQERRVSNFDSPFSVSREETEHMPKTAEKDDQSIKDPLESDLNTLFLLLIHLIKRLVSVSKKQKEP